MIDKAKELETLTKQKETLEMEMKRSEALLSNEQFIAKAPQAKLDIEKEKYANYQKQYEIVLHQLKSHVQTS
jgi:valyl-tRNA synthetase